MQVVTRIEDGLIANINRAVVGECEMPVFQGGPRHPGGRQLERLHGERILEQIDPAITLRCGGIVAGAVSQLLGRKVSLLPCGHRRPRRRPFLSPAKSRK